jgi:hypothetical protein
MRPQQQCRNASQYLTYHHVQDVPIPRPSTTNTAPTDLPKNEPLNATQYQNTLSDVDEIQFGTTPPTCLRVPFRENRSMPPICGEGPIGYTAYLWRRPDWVYRLFVAKARLGIPPICGEGPDLGQRCLPLQDDTDDTRLQTTPLTRSNQPPVKPYPIQDTRTQTLLSLVCYTHFGIMPPTKAEPTLGRRYLPSH